MTRGLAEPPDDHAAPRPPERTRLLAALVVALCVLAALLVVSEQAPATETGAAPDSSSAARDQVGIDASIRPAARVGAPDASQGLPAGDELPAQIDALIRALCAPLTADICEHVDACGCGDEGVATCRVRFQDRCETFVRLNAPRREVVTLDEEEVARCLREGRPDVAECRLPQLVDYHFWAGAAPAQACAAEHPPTLCRGGMCRRGRCEPIGDQGAACQYDSNCRSRLCVDSRCASLGGVGAACERGSAECALAFPCIDAVCSAPRSLGQPCTVTAWCEAGLSCEDGRCAPVDCAGQTIVHATSISVGMRCGRARHCRSTDTYRCARSDPRLFHIFDETEQSDEEPSEPAGLGHPCQTLCQTGLVCLEMHDSRAVRLECQPGLALDAPCDPLHPCGAPLVCDRGSCGPGMAEGEDCEAGMCAPPLVCARTRVGLGCVSEMCSQPRSPFTL